VSEPHCLQILPGPPQLGLADQQMGDAVTVLDGIEVIAEQPHHRLKWNAPAWAKTRKMTPKIYAPVATPR